MPAYSIIIPHKNTPNLLQKCLGSIPERTDLEIIVVDDNSDADKVNFEKFPGSTRKDVQLIFEKGNKGKGPGFARNAGLKNAKGKWIIFSDSDDYFPDSFNQLLNEYNNADEEIIFFKCQRQNEQGEVFDYPLINNAIEQAKQEKAAESIVYGVPCPWGKFIKREFLEYHKIRFQEITAGDDVLFSLYMAVKLKKYALSDSRLYCVVDRPGSLTRSNNWKGFRNYSLACIDAYKLLVPVAKEKYAINWLIAWWGFLWAENKFRAMLLVPKIYKTMTFKHASVCIKKGMKRGAWNWREGQ